MNGCRYIITSKTHSIIGSVSLRKTLEDLKVILLLSVVENGVIAT